MPRWKPRLAGNEDQPLFRQLLQALAEDIASGALPVGALLPPHRDLADQLGVARGTVARAYAEAEQLGLIRGEVGRGTRVLPSDGGERSYGSLIHPPTAISDLSARLTVAGLDPDPSEALRRLADRPDRRSLLSYQAPGGANRHRLAGVRWLERLGVRDIELGDVLIMAGAQHALFVILHHLAPRAPSVYVEELTYPGIQGITESLGLRLVPIAMDEEGMALAPLERAVKRHGPGAIYCMPTLHNPLGIIMPDGRRRAIAELARARGLVLIEDAANRMLVRSPPPLLWSYAPERTFLVASVSKVLSPGLRVAFVLGPRADVPNLMRQIWATQWMIGPIGAEIVAMWLEDGTVDRTLANKRREAKRRQAILREVFSDECLVSNIQALHGWVRLQRPQTMAPLLAEAARREIVMTPSSAFWSRTIAPPAAVRISLGGFARSSALRRSLKRLGDIASSPAP